MGIFGAMTTAVSGLSAQAYALENISGNIANAQTTGFKRTETSFVDMLPDGGPRRQYAGSVNSMSRATNTVQGQIQASNTPTHMAINGDGYFVVQQVVGQQDNRPILGGVNFYTRRGDFEVDRNGLLVNGAGNYLMGLPLDPVTGNSTGSTPVPIRIANDVVPAQVTSRIEYRASLPARPSVTTYDPTVPGSELMAASLRPGGVAAATINPASVDNFLSTSSRGGSVTVYDSQGNALDVQMRWAKVQTGTNGATPTPDIWALYYNSNSLPGNETWSRIGGDFNFNTQGALTSPTTNPTITGLNINGSTVGDVTLDIGINGLTQFARADGSVEVTSIDQNGFAAGKLASVSVTDSGRIRANYTNGRVTDLYETPLATFNGDNLLKRLDGSTFAETNESGSPVFTTAARVSSQSLEGSNVDVSEEFTKLIVTQQAYAANTRIVTTANQMLQETINMVR